MKRLRLLIVAAIALAILAAVAGLRRVPPGFEAVRIARDGSVAPVGSGWQFVGPGVRLVRYPVGDVTLRVPESGTAPVLFASGDSASVAYDVALTVPAGSALPLYQAFSSDFQASLRKLVVSAAEIEAAAVESSVGADALQARVSSRVGEQLAPFKIDVRSLTPAGSASAGGVARTPAPRRLIVVGVDGGDWLNLRPLIDAGKLPNFARLVREGASGPLRSEEPMLSPLLWTTMATGRLPEQHGVLNFTVVDPKTGARVPISRHYRRVDAFWNMLSDAGRTVDVIGWLATDPAETINGVMITDKFGYLAYAPEDTARAEAHSVSPAARAAELSERVVHADAVRDEEIARFVRLPAGEMARHRGSFDPQDPVNNLIHLVASTQSFEKLALHLLETDQPDVLAVYFELVDAVSHLFMLHTPPRMPDVPAAEFERYQNAVEQAYMAQDAILGRIMERMDERTVLMVISDHGFKSGDARLKNRPEIWAGNAAKWHRPDGIVAFLGAGVKPGASIAGASIRDVTPTILALMGLPHAADMAGQALRSAFDDATLATFSTEIVATLDRKRAPDETAASGASEETMKKLEALGYLTPDNADALNNLGQRYQQQREYQKAIEEYKKAIAMRPNFHSAYNNLAVCYGNLKMYPEAEAALMECIRLKPDDFYAMNNLAVMKIETNNLAAAETWAKRAVATEPGYANGHVTLGTVYAMNRRWDDAERQFREALRIEPGNATATDNLERLAAARRAP